MDKVLNSQFTIQGVFLVDFLRNLTAQARLYHNGIQIPHIKAGLVLFFVRNLSAVVLPAGLDVAIKSTDEHP